MNCYILCGVSGSGKSTWAQKVEILQSAEINSADYYFLDSNKEYKFDPTKLTEAHKWCFFNFMKRVNNFANDQIVDNTNTTLEEIAPYYMAAISCGYKVHIVTFKNHYNDLEKLAQRNVHNVPLHTIDSQYKRILNLRIPQYWEVTRLTVTLSG